jgi:hypothetical protein
VPRLDEQMEHAGAVSIQSRHDQVSIARRRIGSSGTVVCFPDSPANPC